MGSQTKEIVTLQLGHYSNFVGCHWWNLQEASFIYDAKEKHKKEIDNDVLFREGANLLGEITYTPRLISVDLKGSLNTLKKEGVLYTLPGEEENINWQNDITLHKSEQFVKNEFLRDLEKEEAYYHEPESIDEDDEDKEMKVEGPAEKSQVFGPKSLYNLDDDIKVWSDFLKIHLHPKTLNIVENFTHESEFSPFDVYNYGLSVYKDRGFHNQLEDRIHVFVEECDHLQGFQIMSDVHNGFGGITGSLLEEICDQYERPIFTIGAMPTVYGDTTAVQDNCRMINTMLSYISMVEQSSIMLPLSCAMNQWRKPSNYLQSPNLQYNANLSYHTSAVLAACLDTATLPLRSDTNCLDLYDLSHVLAFSGRKVANLQATFPFSLSPGEGLIDKLLRLGDNPLWYSLTPCSGSATGDVASQSVVLRGITNIKTSMTQNLPTSLKNCKSADEVLQIYLQDLYPATNSMVNAYNTACKTSKPYPHIFHPNLKTDGLIHDNFPRPINQGVDSVPVLTSLQSNSSTADMLSSLRDEVKRINIHKFAHIFLETHIDLDEYNEVIEKLENLITNYSSSEVM
ncbi:protein misato homolog 1-like [Tubulanus polymorphus]|uniref:protein misato homolog 1-like n=1 Tax=Tubulanus polymorphus TaxID=672921 RepID=UPI003DA22EDE